MKNSESGQSDSFTSFLKSLKGKIVTVYRKGPESKTGKLLDVQRDFLTLSLVNSSNNQLKTDENKQQDNEQISKQNNSNSNVESTVIYYNTFHVKSIIEDTKVNSSQEMEESLDGVEFQTARNFMDLLGMLINKKIQLNQGGPDSKKGTLLGVTNDFLVFNTDDGLFYINVHHIKSVSQIQDSSNNNESTSSDEEKEKTVYPEIIRASSFLDVFKQLESKWVSFNHKGPKGMEGILIRNSDGHYSLVKGHDLLHVNPHHVKSISIGENRAVQKETKQDQEEKVDNETGQNSKDKTSDKQGSSKKESNKDAESNKQSKNKKDSASNKDAESNEQSKNKKDSASNKDAESNEQSKNKKDSTSNKDAESNKQSKNKKDGSSNKDSKSSKQSKHKKDGSSDKDVKSKNKKGDSSKKKGSKKDSGDNKKKK